jgi:hypothetical protein
MISKHKRKGADRVKASCPPQRRKGGAQYLGGLIGTWEQNLTMRPVMCAVMHGSTGARVGASL